MTGYFLKKVKDPDLFDKDSGLPFPPQWGHFHGKDLTVEDCPLSNYKPHVWGATCVYCEGQFCALCTSMGLTPGKRVFCDHGSFERHLKVKDNRHTQCVIDAWRKVIGEKM